MIDKELAQRALGVAPLPSFRLDASVLDDKEVIDELRDVVKRHNIVFEFPDGLAKVDIREECRALCDSENFDTMYDL